MRSRFLDIAIFHREVRCVEKSRWKMLKPSSGAAFGGVSQVEKAAIFFPDFLVSFHRDFQ